MLTSGIALPELSMPVPRRRPTARTPTRASTWARIHAVVRRIPRGRVATYGQIAVLASLPGQARLVGYAMSALPAHSPVPWHRVVNAAGRISVRGEGAGGVTQRILLEREGIRFGGDRIDLERFGWRPRATATPRRRRPSPRSRVHK